MSNLETDLLEVSQFISLHLYCKAIWDLTSSQVKASDLIAEATEASKQIQAVVDSGRFNMPVLQVLQRRPNSSQSSGHSSAPTPLPRKPEEGEVGEGRRWVQFYVRHFDRC